MYNDWFDVLLNWLISLTILAGAALIFWVVFLAIQDARAWSKYQNENDCVQTGLSRDVGTHLHPVFNGKTTTYVPMQKTEYQYQCNNGEIWK